MKKKILTYIITFCFILSIFSCTKEEFTKPAEVKLEMVLKAPDGSHSGGKKDYLAITGGHFKLAAFEFDGDRTEGEDFFFTKKFDTALEAQLKEEASATAAFKFNIPQGIYKRMGIHLSLKKGFEDNGDDGDDDERERSDDQPGAKKGKGKVNKDAAIYINGTYEDNKKELIPFIFVYNFDDVYKYIVKNKSSSEIVVEKGKENTIKFVFDPEYWMQLINARMFQSAKLQELNGVPTIVISAEQNKHIYDVLTSRIEKSTDLLFE